MAVNPYIPVKATIEDVISETPTIKTFVLKPETPFSFKTGQFIELTYPGYGEAPFTPSSNPADTNQIEVTIVRTGHMTNHLHLAKKGNSAGIRGPYGEGYPVEKFYGKDILIMGGGVGLAPLRSFIFAITNEREKFNKIIIGFGARTPVDMCYYDDILTWQDKFDVDVYLTVDSVESRFVKENGKFIEQDKPVKIPWKHETGVVTNLFDNLDFDKNNVIGVSCGPPIMMKFGTKKFQEIGVPDNAIYLSMERNMSCGIGQCRHCMLDHYYICKDGPVFVYDEIKDLKTDIFK